MSWKKIAEVSAIVGKYQKDGKDKNKYMNCGIVLENENGNKCIKLTCFPIKEDGMLATFLGVYPLQDQAPPQPKAPPAPPVRDEFDSDIPF